MAAPASAHVRQHRLYGRRRPEHGHVELGAAGGRRSLLEGALQANDLGEFLRAHRARLNPADVGLPSFDVRGAPGQLLVVHQSEPGSPGADALSRLRPPGL